MPSLQSLAKQAAAAFYSHISNAYNCHNGGSVSGAYEKTRGGDDKQSSNDMMKGDEGEQAVRSPAKRRHSNA